MLATRNDDMQTSPDGDRRPAKVLAKIAVACDPDTGHDGWERRAIGPGAHGMRVYDWTAVTLDTDGLPEGWGTGSVRGRLRAHLGLRIATRQV